MSDLPQGCAHTKSVTATYQLVCGLRRDHGPNHWDPLSGVRWTETKEATKQ